MNEDNLDIIEESPETQLDNNEEETTLSSPKGEIKGDVHGDKKALDKLLKKKKVLVVGLLLAFIFFLLLVMAVMEGSEVHDYVYYENGESLKNHKVSITYRKFGEEEEKESEMDLEEYITKAVYAYSKDIKNIEKKENKRFDYHVYWALAIALRNEALTNNYEVEYHDDKDLFKTFEKDEQIDFALEKAKGLVMVDKNDQLVSTRASSFCWKELDEEKHVLLQNGLYVPNDFSDSYVSYDVYNECECNKSSGIIESSVPFDDEDPQCWLYFEEEIEHHYIDANGNDATDIEIIYKKEYLHQEQEDGFSLYGAYYFWHEKGLNYLQILTTFYGADIRIKTLENKGNNEESSVLAYDKGSQSSFCNTSSSTANFDTFLNGWEGHEGLCNQNASYAAKDLQDGARFTIGYGVTNHVVNTAYSKELIDANGWGSYFRINSKGEYDLEPGDCVPIEVIDALKINSVEKEYAASVDKAALKYGLNLTQFQRDAVTSLNYNCGSEWADKVLSAYSTGGLESLWGEWKTCQKSRGKVLEGLMKRRKGEFALFVTGDYTDQGKFYDHRGVSDYDNYNSESVVERAAKCANQGKDGFALPLPLDSNFHCTSPFGNRIHPITGVFHNHSGLDLGVASGTDIYASKDGMVYEVGFNHSSMGNYVKIRHEDGTKTVYMHMLNNSITVSKNQEVSQGEKIGEVGMTGSATGPHLHFTIYDSSNNLVDPYDYLDLSMLSDTSSCHL